tara:strand:- start:119012 stop:120166 length:1155 start_codon:yes stop_codon:yes gene_type:complete
MARVKRGTGTIKRKNARNYTHKQAQARLQETVEPFNQQVLNSLYVDSVEVDYYQAQARIGKTCTCEKVEVRPEHNSITGHENDYHVEPVVPTVDEDSSSELGVRLQDDNLFGDSPAEKLYGENVMDVSGYDDMADDDIPEELYRDVTAKEGDVAFTETTMFGSNANCGICYKTGFQPGYKAYGKQRHVLTTWDIERISGYTVVTTNAPNSMRRQGPIEPYNFVEFAINVPKYFQSVTYSLRNNTQVLTGEKFMIDWEPASLRKLKEYAGKTAVLQVQAKEFTHLVLEFDLGMDKVRANLGPESRALDYSKMDALSNFPIVLPPNIHEVSTGDIVVVRDRRLVLKVMDMERKITADKRQLEWMVQTRLVQRTEPLREIAKGLKLL